MGIDQTKSTLKNLKTLNHIYFQWIILRFSGCTGFFWLKPSSVLSNKLSTRGPTKGAESQGKSSQMPLALAPPEIGVNSLVPAENDTNWKLDMSKAFHEIRFESLITAENYEKHHVFFEAVLQHARHWQQQWLVTWLVGKAMFVDMTSTCAYRNQCLPQWLLGLSGVKWVLLVIMFLWDLLIYLQGVHLCNFWIFGCIAGVSQLLRTSWTEETTQLSLVASAYRSLRFEQALPTSSSTSATGLRSVRTVHHSTVDNKKHIQQHIYYNHTVWL